jgi:hypothetical protein
VSRPLRVTPRGLPGALPDGERLLWQGSPAWASLARRAFHLRKVAVYFGALILWRGWSAVEDGRSLADAAAHAAWALPAAGLALGLLALLAWGYARTSIYTLTTRRLVIRTGLALPMTMNLPFSAIRSAGLATHRDGTGDIAIGIMEGQSAGRLVLWPHVRFWLARPEPLLRSLADAQTVARLLAKALAESAGQTPEAIAAAKPPETGQAWIGPGAIGQASAA